jgi:NADPH:quinone reductase-like Zn-dependent oxidoreductase
VPKPDGLPGHHLIGPLAPMSRLIAVNTVARQRLRVLPPRQDQAELPAVIRLIEEEKLRSVIGGTYQLADVAEGLRKIEEGHVRGKIIITT